MKATVVAMGVAFGIAGAFLVWNNLEEGSPDQPIQSATDIVAVEVPALSAAAEAGRAVFNARCATCHGLNAAGVEGAGPPLVHKIYEPSHHGDAAFVLAVRRGVPRHHWSFGNMAPVEGVTDQEILGIITYVRELQRANGIN